MGGVRHLGRRTRRDAAATRPTRRLIGGTTGRNVTRDYYLIYSLLTGHVDVETAGDGHIAPGTPMTASGPARE